MVEVVCPGLPGGWVNAWLAAVGATVLDERLRLCWTHDPPVAVLSAESVDPVDALVESWPDGKLLSGLPIAEDWRGAGKLQRKVPVEVFQERVQAARGHRHSWPLSSTITDLCVDEKDEVAHAPFDPAGPGTVKWLHHRLVKVHRHVASPTVEERVRASLAGEAERVNDNGLGFDQTRIGSLSDESDKKFVDPVVEVLAFFGLALLPMRGNGVDKGIDRGTRIDERQRGWRRVGGRGRDFHWPAWGLPLDGDAIDALMDAWDPDRKDRWARFGVHAGWRSLRFQPRGSSDTTRGIGAERL